MLVRGDAYAGVGYREAQAALLVGGRLQFQSDRASLCELDRVVQQVDDHLPQTVGITHQGGRNGGGTAHYQLKILVPGAEGERLESVSQGVLQVELDRVKLEPPRLDLRDIENAVENGQ